MTTQNQVPAQWISNFQIVLPDKAHQHLLLLPGDVGWTLPFLAIEGRVWVGNSRRIIAALGDRLGLAGHFSVLRYLRMEINEPERWDRIVLVLERHEAPKTAAPLGGRWVDRQALAGWPLVDEELRGLLLNYLDEEAAGQVVALRAPWAKTGWFASASAWLTESLFGLGRAPIGPVQQFKNLGISSLLRVPTEAGLVYCKATARLPLFVNEAVLMKRLAARFPDQIPAPLAIEAKHGWMLLDDFGADMGSSSAGVEELDKALRQYAALQRASAGTVDELLGLGCFDRRLPVLTDQIDRLLSHALSIRHMKPDDLSQLRSLAPQIKERCAQLAGYRLPDTLVHGDLHAGNIARHGERYLFYDWSDACISHPFLDMITPYFFQEDSAERDQLRDGYLSQWTAWGSTERLRQAWQLAKPLAALHQAVSYLHILLGQEELVHLEMADGLRGFAAQAVAALTEEDAQKG